MRIETGTTNERLARCGILALALCVFAGWFYKDGWYTYQRRALESFQRYLQLEELPEPHPKLDYAYPEEQRPEYKKRVAGGLTKKEVLEELGEPIVVRQDPADQLDDWHYVGQYCRIHYEVERAKDPNAGKVLAVHIEQAPADYRYESVQQQRFWAIVCAVLGVLAIAWFIKVWRTRVVVDESGLTYNSKHIAWDDMVDLDGADYAAKGWVTLIYTQQGKEKTMRLDSFKIDAYRDVIDAICRRKGFANPIPIDDFGEVPPEGDEPIDQASDGATEDAEPGRPTHETQEDETSREDDEPAGSDEDKPTT